MVIAYLALGSNLGDRGSSLRAALDRVNELPHTVMLAVSSFHETDPVDAPAHSGAFLNAAAALETELPPAELMQSLLRIEESLGRQRSGSDPRNAPRPIDLDLLAYGGEVLQLPNLTVPHPRMHDRAFVLEPLAEIAPDFVHPATGATIAQMLHRLKDATCR